MGRITNSFRIKLNEATLRIKTELCSLLANDKRRKAFDEVVKAWYEEANAIGNFSQPYIYGSLSIFSIIDLQRQIIELREEIAKLRKMLKSHEGMDNRPNDLE